MTQQAISSYNPSDKPASAHTKVVRPAVDIFENADEYLLVADVPGVPAEGLDIQLNADELQLHGQSATGNLAYSRAFTIGDQIDAQGIQADLKAGVLRLKLAKNPRRKPQKISIKSN